MTSLSQFSSIYNQLASESIKAKKIEIHDLTLEADGEEMAGLQFSHDERLEIAKRLDEIGIHRISVLGNSPKPTRKEIKSAEAILALNLNLKVGAFVKTIEEIDLCAKLGVWGVTILVAVNDNVLNRETTKKNILDHCILLTSHARHHGLHVALMGMDATRASPSFLKELITTLDPFFDEYVIADSLGRATPFGIKYLANLINNWTVKPLQLHAHNTTSMAVANCLGGLYGGVSILHTAVNGLGEFTGIPPTEECVVALEMHTMSSLGLDLLKFQELSTLVNEITGMTNFPGKPVTGKGAFSIPETAEIQKVLYELYCNGRFDDGLPYPPGIVGAQAKMSIGRKCNEYTVLYNLAINQHAIKLCEAKAFAKEIRRLLKKQRGYILLENEDFMNLFTAWKKNES